MRLWLILLLLFQGLGLRAQTFSWDDFVALVQDDEQSEAQAWATHLEDLALLHAEPLDINTATRDDLRRLPMLTDEQIEDIHTYVFLHRGLRSMAELMAIESLDWQTRRILPLFLYAGQEVFVWKDTLSARNLWREARHDLLLRTDVPLYYREGHLHSPEQGGYLGSPLAYRALYRLQSMRRLDAGLRAERDAGEPGTRPDAYGGFLLWKDLGLVSRALVGDYQLGFGEGLVMNLGFSAGKTLLARPLRGLRPHTSTDEHRFLRGTALALRLGSVETTLWLSTRRWDTSLNNEAQAATLLTSGLHRTWSERQRKENLHSLTSGANVAWSRGPLRLGLTGYFQKFDRILNPGEALYRRYHPRGSHFGTAGLHYGYRHHVFTFSGETAYSTAHSGWATLHRLALRPTSGYTLTASQRFYTRRYHSFYASALSENTQVQNESGLLLHLDARPIDGWVLTAYADFFHHPWPRYGLSANSRGLDFMLQTDHSLSARHTLSLRLQYKRKEQARQGLQGHTRLRLRHTLQCTPRLRLQSTALLHHAATHTGFALAQQVRSTLPRTQSVLAAQLTYFHSPEFNTRLYLYEPTLPRAFYYPALYGEGMRWVLLVRQPLWHNRLQLEAKYASIVFFDRSTQGTGMQRIHSPWRHDLSVQLRIRL